MTWTNAFDLGSCLVEVFQVATPDSPDYSATLVKGTGADLTLASWTMHIAVSSDGVVTLTNSGSALEVDVGARVVPAYSLASMLGARAVLPASASGAGDASADGTGLASFANGDAAVILSDLAPYDRISIQTNTIGSSSVNPVVQFTPEFDVAPPPPTIPVCTELGRVTRIYASGYDRSRVHDGRLVRGESRCLVVEFNGAIPAGRTVASVTWRCADPSVVVMSNARIQTGARSVAVDVRANLPCNTAIKCEATLDNGERYMQLIRLAVMDSPWFGDETTAPGPATLTSP